MLVKVKVGGRVTFCCVSHIGMTDSTVIGQYCRQWLAKIIPCRPVDRDAIWVVNLGGPKEPQIALENGSVWGFSPIEMH